MYGDSVKDSVFCFQVQGMGTALKILFSGSGMGPSSIVSPGAKNSFQLRRTEIVSLLNGFGR